MLLQEARDAAAQQRRLRQLHVREQPAEWTNAAVATTERGTLDGTTAAQPAPASRPGIACRMDKFGIHNNGKRHIGMHNSSSACASFTQRLSQAGLPGMLSWQHSRVPEEVCANCQQVPLAGLVTQQRHQAALLTLSQRGQKPAAAAAAATGTPVGAQVAACADLSMCVSVHVCVFVIPRSTS